VIEDNSGAALAWILVSSRHRERAAVARRRDRPPDRGTMSHDKIRDAARQRMAETGEPYAAARRAVTAGHQAAGDQNPAPGAGDPLQMSGEIHDWLADLRDRDPAAARLVVRAVAAVMSEGAALTGPLVVSTADAWPWALSDALNRSYQQRLEELTRARRREADAVILVRDIQAHAGELASVRAELADRHRRAQQEGRAEEATQTAGHLAAVEDQEARLRQMLPGVMKARYQLREATHRKQTRTDAFRVRKEVLKASYAAAVGQIGAREALAASGLAGDDQDGPDEDGAEAIDAARARLAGITAQMEREAGQEARPEGLMELRPGAPDDTDLRVLFAVEPGGATLLTAVLEGAEAVEEHYPEAILLAADMLRRARDGQAPEAAAYGYDTRSFLDEFQPGA